MISTMWFSAPAGVSGAGSLAARPAAVAGESRLRTLPVSAAVARPRVPGAPVCGIAPAFDLVPTGRGVVVRTPDARDAAFVTQHDQQNDGTTLGIPSSRRPLS